MTFTVTLTELSVFIIAIAFLILVVSAIPAIMQIRRAVKSIQDFSTEGAKFFISANEISGTIKDNIEDIGAAVKKGREVSLKVAGIIEILADAFRGPVVTLVGLIAGLTVGLKNFRKEAKKDGGE